MPAYEISGTYNGSAIEQGLQRLQQQLNSLKAPKIAPQVDMSNFFNQMDKSASYATQGRMSKLFSGVDFGGIGRQAGSQYATSFMAGLGPIGGAASDLALAIGPIGLAAGVAAAGIALIGAKSVQAAAAWESMATSIGRTTGLEGKNLTSLMDSLQELRMEMGITREAAAGLVEQAGSIGVGQAWLDKGDVVAYKNELLDFARSTAMLQGAWGMSAEATSAGIGKMGSVTIGAWNAQRRAMGEQELSWSDYAESVGGKVDSLANTMGSSEEEIVTAMRNASSAVASFAPTEDTYGKWLALSSFLIDTGASAGEAGTQIERMAKGAKQHGAELAQIVGMDNAQFQEALKNDFVGTFQAIAEELASMPEGDRPDMIKLLGIEGSGAMDKMIADVKTGVNKLNKAIKLDPSNITEGFEKVADDANTAFARIGQAAQVSFEQMGGVILPIVTDIANAMADAWQGANEAGRELWKAGGGIVSNLLQGNLGDVTINGEMYNVSLSGIRKKTAEEIAAGAKEGADEASSEVAESLTSDISEKVASELEEAAKEFDAAWADKFADLVESGISKEIAGIMAAFNVSDMRALDIINAQTKSKNEYGGLWGRGSGTIVADEEGINYKIYYSTDKVGTTSYLYIDDQLMGETREASSKEAAIQDLFSQASARDKLTETLSLNLQGRSGEAALVVETVDVELDFDVDVATKNANQSLKKFSESQNWGDYLFGDKENTVLGELEWASNVGNEVVKSAVDGIGNALQDVSLENYPQMVAGVEALNRELGDMWGGFGPRSDVYTKLQSQYADAVLAGVIDAKDLLKAQRTETTNLLADSLADGYITGSEKGALEARKTLLGLLKERYPVEFEAAGLDKIASDIQATLDGRAFSIDVKPEVEFEANFALWKKDHAALYEKIYATTGQNPTGAEQEERYRYEQRLAEEGSESSKKILKWLDEWDSALERGDYSSYDAIGKRLMDLDPNLPNQKWFTQTLETATKDVTANFQVLNGQLIPLGDSAKTLAGQFADAAAIIAVANGSLQSSAMQARGAVAMEGWRNIVSQVNTVGHLKTTPIAKTEPLKLNIKDYRDVGRFNIPALAEGGKVTGSGLAWIGEAGTEYVIPEEDIKGLYPQSAAVDKGSMSYLTGGKYFDDYPHRVSYESYRRSQFPNAPPVITTGNQPTAWLSDPQTTGNEWISGEIRAAQLRAMGLTEDNVLKSPKVARELTNRDMWNAIYDNSGTCIAFVEPDPSLNFYPGKNYLPGGKGYGNLDMPVSGYSGAAYGYAASASSGGAGGQWLTDKDKIAASQGTSDGLVMPSGAVSDALTNRTAWNAIYDNSGTCIAFVEPDPSLNFTPGKDYLPGGKGLGNMGSGYTSLGDQEISSWDSVAEESIKTAKATEETAKYSEETAKNTKMIGTAISEVAGGLVMGGGYGSGGSSILGLANRGGAAIWGGTSVSGMGGWVGSGRSATGWGAQAVSGSSGSFGGSSGWGSVKWAEGGFADRATFGVFGEAGREAFVPISDRAAGLRILPRVMQELGVATFARGGIVGSGGSSGAIGGVTLNYAPKIQGAGMSEGQLKRMLKESSNDLMRQVEKQFYKEKR